MAKLTPTNVLNTAYKWNAYCEKASSGTDSQLQNKTWNAGYNNITWFWVYLDRLSYGNYQGQPWCDGWVDFVFIETAGGGKEGYKRAKAALGGFSAYTPTSAEMFRKISPSNYIKPSGTPKPGDVIFFKDSTGLICHTGIVVKVTSSTVYTIEGNTSSASGVVANGGCVREKSYDRSYSRIACYGRPKWESGEETGPISGSSYAEQVWNWLLDHGYSRQAAAGILGNMKQESDVNPKCLQSPHPYAAGIVQWERYDTNSGRFALMKKYAEKKKKTWQDLRCQLEFLDLELSGGDVELGGDGYTATLLKKYAGSYSSFKNCTDIENAVKIFHDAFERSSQPMWNVRYKAANDFFKKFNGTGGSSSGSSSSTLILRKGDRGDEVLRMQKLLLNRGYYLGEYGADGDFGQATYEAVREFQAYHGLEIDGEYGPASRAILEQPFNRDYLQKGDSGESVRTMQLLLLKAGYNIGAAGADGNYNTDVVNAVKKFQKKHGLTVTGKYDENTKHKLNDVVSKIDNQMAEDKKEENKKPATSGSTTTTTEKDTYSYGMRDSKVVKEMQTLLRDKWKYDITPSGTFGQSTLEIVVDFQTKHGLETSGKLTPDTMKKIKGEEYHEIPDNWISKYQLGVNMTSNACIDVTGKWNEETGKSVKVLTMGSSGYMVRLLQEILVTKIKRKLTISGSYDKETKEAVTYVQYYYGLEETGKVGRSEWNVLLTCDYPVK